MLSCNSGSTISDDTASIPDIESVRLYHNPDKTGPAPALIFEEVKALVKTIEEMSESELDSLDESSISELSAPLVNLAVQTVRFSPEALAALTSPMLRAGVYIREGSLNEISHEELSSEIREISADFLSAAQIRSELSTDQIKELFTEWNKIEGYGETCKTLFNVNSGGVFLVPGDNFGAAHKFCEESSFFYLSDGTYYRQTVKNIRRNVSWIGSSDSVMDGMETTGEAFSFGMKGANYGWFQIVNYIQYGIRAIQKTGTADISIRNMNFRNIGKEVNGQKYGAVIFEWAQGVEIINSQFEDVTSGIRFLNSRGPLRVMNNEAKNSGRNFFQCDKCTGAGIRIERNTIEHTQQFGTEKLEDFISLFQSSGTEQDYIRVSENRARTDGTGEGVSPSGSFIILGDHGGSYQIAEKNIGVNPGNVGVGAAGGHHIQMVGNKMYSDPVRDISNVAFYSFLGALDSHVTCGNHVSRGNRAYWFCLSDACEAKETALLNKAFSPDLDILPVYCGLTNLQINADPSVLEDPSLDHNIWDDF